MKSCDEKESVLEKNENQQEEIEGENTYLNENGRHLVFSLLRISEKNSEEDENSMESVIGTGWEGAVQGWGRASPFACLQPPKKARKTRVGETLNNCLLCLDMLQVMDKNVSLETKATAPPSKPAGKSPVASVVSSGQDNFSAPAEGFPTESSKSTSTLGAPKKDMQVHKLCSTHASPGEQKQVKECKVWFQENLKYTVATGSLASREMKKGLNLDSAVLNSSIGSENEESLLLNTFQVLPPVGSAVCNDQLDVSLRKNKGIVMPQQEKGLSRALMDNPPPGNMIKKTEQLSERGNAERKTDFSSKELKSQETMPVFAAGIPRVPVLREHEYFYWQCSFVPSKTSPTSSSAVSSKQNDQLTMKLLQTRTAQNSRPNLRPDDPKPHCSTIIRNDSKQRIKSKIEMNSLLTAPLLPALTVTRVEIPVSSYRPL